MWIVLLDHSGSMGEPFHGYRTFSGRSVTSRGGTKLEEARRALYERVRGLAPSEEVVVIAFTSKTSIIFDGLAGQSEELQSALDRLEATNGTSIAAAFDAVFELLEPKGKTASRVLLVSDCKSELSPAVASADRLIRFVHVIDILLIDPDQETEDAARAMIRLGEVQAVLSPEELRTAVTDGDTAAGQVATAMARVIEDAQSAASEALEQRARDEGEPVGKEVGFSAGYAPLLSPGHSAPLVVVVHPADLKKEVGEVIAHLLADQISDPRIAADGRTRLPIGAEIRIEPVVPGIRINPARIELVWQDRIEDFRFTMTAEPNAVEKYAIGSVNVWYGPAQISCIPVSVEISECESIMSPTIKASGLFGSIFPSYSRKDKSVVDRARGYYEALGIAVLQDTEALRSLAGVNWERALDGLILKADAFQLYWSYFAATSVQVEREWRFALMQNSLKGDRWIRPLRWTDDVPKLPPEISHLQMGWLPGFEDTESPRTPAAESIRCTVTPLVDCPPEYRKIVERECCEAVHHVETTTGLRCYPPPILLVDEYVFQQESRQSPLREFDESLIKRFAAASDVLQALSLDVHTRFGRGKLNGKSSPHVDLSLSLSDDTRRIALNLAEWIFASVTDTILGITGFVQPRNYGVSSSSPEEVKLRELRPSERLAEAVSSENVRGWGSTIFLSQDLNQLPDTSIKWLNKQSSGLQIRIEDDKVRVEVKEEPLRAIVQLALTPVVAEAIDNANPFAIHKSGGKPPELAVFAWLAPTYFRSFAHRTDCAAFAESIGVPSWRSKLEEFAAAAGYGAEGAVDLIEYLLLSLQHAFDEVETSYGSNSEFVTGYGIGSETLNTLGTLEVRSQSVGSESWTHMVGTIPALKRLFIEASEIFLESLRTIRSKLEGNSAGSLAQAHTYGVFIQAGVKADRQFADWATKHAIPESLTFPGSDRVLLCLNALQHCIHNIQDKNARGMVRFSVLIHELLHATISSAVGSDQTRQTARQEARNVEESLAVWLEFDAARKCPAMRDLINEYVSSGVYPEWPYAGMNAIEAKFASEGRKAIQFLTNNMITDPKSLKGTFDNMVAAENHARKMRGDF